ncbi:MAG: hypothetical protein KatS3mg105_4788 [Gemmatales bacterium]|nr:MAG: hypothetical protein KatS3mg105_4788 [Gemmatales bacterium]
MEIRNYQAGDEKHQAEVYNEAAADLPGFKPATVAEVERRCQARGFDPASRFYAVENGRIVAYAMFNANGRVNFPWCRPGFEHARQPLFDKVIQALKDRGVQTVFAAYRSDWTEQWEFFQSQGFAKKRDMLNYVLELASMPTRTKQPPAVTPLRREDVPAIYQLAPHALRAATAAELENHLFRNPYFSAECCFVRRNSDGTPNSIGILIQNADYADPRQVDPQAPCYRLGAFGTEGMNTKRIRGLFSFLAPDDEHLMPRGLALLETAASKAEERNLTVLAGQVPSDAPHLVAFYDAFFQKQGSFPVYERTLG